MKKSSFQQDIDLGRIILQIITDCQAITAMEVWYELGEDDRFAGGIITRAEVNEVMSILEKQNIIVKGKDDRWKINSTGTPPLSH